MSRRLLRIGASVLVTGLATWYIVAKTDLAHAARILGDANLGYFVAALAITAATVPAMAWRWRLLLAARGIEDGVGWLTRAYLVSYTAGMILPTSIGGDAMRILETSRRHPGRGGPVAGAVLLERALGGAATLLLAAIGFALAIGRYPVGPYLWVELAFVVATVALGVVLFSRSVRPLLRRTAPLLRAVRLERPLRAVYEAIHAYRSQPRVLGGVVGLTVVVQAARVLPIWLTGKAVGVDLSPRPYYVMGPLLFLVVLIPFTVSGLAVRESFFVSFLTRLDVSPEAALACGLLYFLVTVGLALPGAFVLGWEGVRGRTWTSPSSS